MVRKVKRLPTSLLFFLLIVYALAVYFGAYEQRILFPQSDLPIRLYTNQAGHNLQSTFKQAILSAKRSIVLIIYALTDDELTQALNRQAEAGVSVFIVSDPLASQELKTRLSPRVQHVSRRSRGLMHNKLLAIDDKLCFLGSANFTRESLLLHANLVMGIESPALASHIKEKAQNLAARKVKRLMPLTICCQEQQLQFSFLPDDKEALEKLLGCIRCAKRSIKVAMFTFTNAKLIDALVSAHKRGVDVQVVLDHDSSRKTSQKAHMCFQKERMKVFVSKRRGLLHEKVAIIDDATLIMGSANWTNAAFGLNDENVCFLTAINPSQRQTLDAFWKTTLFESERAASQVACAPREHSLAA